MKHYYENVPGLGNVAVSRHALSQMFEVGISQEAFDRALLDPTQPNTPDGPDIVWRERDGLRLVILTNPDPEPGGQAREDRVPGAGAGEGHRGQAPVRPARRFGGAVAACRNGCSVGLLTAAATVCFTLEALAL